MNHSDFKKKGSNDDFVFYKLKNKTPTNIGKFRAELLMDDCGDLDDQMIALLGELINYGVEHSSEILNLVYEHYLEACKNDSEWVEDCEVPLGVKIEKIMKYVERKTFTINEDAERPSGYDSYIHIIPLWDEEHTLYIRYSDSLLEAFDPMSD